MYAIRDAEGKFVGRSHSKAGAHRATRRANRAGSHAGPLTVRIHTGEEVLAKPYKGRAIDRSPSALTYSNRTQAHKKAVAMSEIHPGHWIVIERGRGHWYVKHVPVSLSHGAAANMAGVHRPDVRAVERAYGLQEGETYDYEDEATSSEARRIGGHSVHFTTNENTGYITAWVKGAGVIASGHSMREVEAAASRKLQEPGVSEKILAWLRDPRNQPHPRAANHARSKASSAMTEAQKKERAYWRRLGDEHAREEREPIFAETPTGIDAISILARPTYISETAAGRAYLRGYGKRAYLRDSGDSANRAGDVQKRSSGSGPYSTYFETGGYPEGTKTINIHRYKTLKAARYDALQMQRAHGGYVGIQKGGLEIGSVGPSGASWLGRGVRE